MSLRQINLMNNSLKKDIRQTNLSLNEANEENKKLTQRRKERQNKFLSESLNIINKKMELEIGEIEEDKNKDDNDYIKKKRTRNKSISSYSKNSEYSKISNSSNKSKKTKWKNDTKFYNEDYETNNQNIKKEGSEEGEID